MIKNGGFLIMNMSYCRFRNTKNDVEDCLSALEEGGLLPKVRAFVWMQGEADGSNYNWANEYKQRLKCFFNDFRKFRNNIISFNHKQPPRFCVQYSLFYLNLYL